jgi:hypothetical protein
MIRWFLNRWLRSFEKEFDYDITYARDILDADLAGISHLSHIGKAANYRKDVPLGAWYAAKIAATLSEDCGPCTQLVVTMAERAGVSPAALRAILADDERSMTPDSALGFRFAQAVMRRNIDEADTLRAEIVERWGRRALVSLAMAISTSIVFPNLKYALGHGRACTRVRVAGADAPLAHRESLA